MPAHSAQFLILLALLIAACNPVRSSQAATRTVNVEGNATVTFTPSLAPGTATSTPDDAHFAQATAIVQAVVAAAERRLYASYLSPNKKWRADILLYDCVRVQASADENAYEELRLVQVETGSETTVDGQLQNCGGVGAYGLGGLSWSSNSRYFYYTDAREGRPDGLCGYWAAPIRRTDIVTQTAEPVGGGQLSPDKTRLAIWQDDEIVIWSLDEGEMARIPAIVRDAFPDGIAWSPDGQSLVYLQTELDCLSYGKSYLARLDLAGLVQELLFESESPSFGGLAWDAPDRIRLVDDQGNQWSYNLSDRELRPVP